MIHITEVLPAGLASVAGLGLPMRRDAPARRVAVRLPHHRLVLMDSDQCRWDVLEAVYTPSVSKMWLWRLLRLLPLQWTPAVSQIAERTYPSREQDVVRLDLGVMSRRFITYVGGSALRPSVVLAFLAENDCVSGYARVGFDSVSCQQVEREKAILSHLSGVSVSGVRWPAVTESVRAGLICASALTAPGDAYSGSSGTPTADEMRRAQHTLRECTAHVRVVSELLSREAACPLCMEIREAIMANHGDREISCCLVHGDFAPWNARTNGGSIFLFDWVNGTTSGPAFYDWLYLEHQLARLLGGASPTKCASVLKRAVALRHDHTECDLVLWVYLFWRAADAVLNDSVEDLAEAESLWNALLGRDDSV